ncbi:hypothetical protein P152DRAFT_453890 [Eremomyces bilateralis CBS 781.70]|uniref:Pantetheine-phosphate adenylyltransferase family protein-like protein n=1 Tax=Eremomyces bilateralis CBS 781.70 TaxID=1392243 RepID=A0A6G1GHF9_9PEZI|nr:uncharacterized protein P152DRAFT_453890 [Eremomyces bilateralis CBS 781.70]KAF1817309.1 hypothetical protein P152DRAFT_453890 [Eremomyces bilateralis CBS 781.70]
MAPAFPARDSILLLPPPPQPPSFQSLRATYETSLKSVLRSVNSPSRTSTLDIALPLPFLYGASRTPRSVLYRQTQDAVAGLYKLIVVAAAQEGVDINPDVDGDGEGQGGVDVRILLVAEPRRTGPRDQGGWFGEVGVVVELETLARSGRRWEVVWGVDGEDGETILRRFVEKRRELSRFAVRRVGGGIVQVASTGEAEAPRVGLGERRKHYASVVGGTFDHIHIGHKLLLTMTAFMVDELDTDQQTERSVTIGITNDALLANKKYAELLQSWDARRVAVERFLIGIMDYRPTSPASLLSESPSDLHVQHINQPGPNGHAWNVTLVAPTHAAQPAGDITLKLVEIGDPFGPTITEPGVSVLVISAETRSGGAAVNQKRREKGWADMEVLEVDVLDSGEVEDDGRHKDASGRDMRASFEGKLSSTEIRKERATRGRSKV